MCQVKSMVIHLQYTGMLCLHCGLVGVHFKFQMRHISMPSFSLCRDYVQMSCLKNRFFSNQVLHLHSISDFCSVRATHRLGTGIAQFKLSEADRRHCFVAIQLCQGFKDQPMTEYELLKCLIGNRNGPLEF